MLGNLSMGDLEAFVAVADNLSFHTAAKALNISPSALSRRIQKLEDRLGTQLLQRTTRDVHLTVAGMQIYSRAQELTDSLHSLLDASADNARHTRRVIVGCTTSHAQTFIPPALKRCEDRFPEIFAVVRPLEPSVTFDMIRRGTLDFGIADMGLQENGLDFNPFCSDRLMLAVHPEHSFATRRRLAWSEVVDEKFIGLGDTSPVRMLVALELTRAQVKVSPSYIVGNLHGALNCVAEGVGVTATPEIAGSAFVPKIALVPLDSPSIVVDRGLVRADDRTLRPAAQAFWDCLKDVWGDRAQPTGPWP